MSQEHFQEDENYANKEIPESSTSRQPVKLTKKRQELLRLYNTAFLNGFQQNVCSNSLRNSHPFWSFSKAERFQQIYIDNNAQYLQLPNTSTPKKCGLGFGERLFLKKLPCAESPPPNQYRLYSAFEHTRSGKSFGIPYKYYANVRVPQVDCATPQNLEVNPGPGTYYFAEKDPIGKKAKKFALKSRIDVPNKAKTEVPAPNIYSPKMTLTHPTTFSGISFGIGNRSNPNNAISCTFTPGPGTYKIRSPFDKFRRLHTSGSTSSIDPRFVRISKTFKKVKNNRDLKSEGAEII